MRRLPALTAYAFLLIAFLLAGCADDPAPSEAETTTSFLTALEIATTDLDGVDVDALLQPFDTDAIIEGLEAMRAEEAGASSAGKRTVSPDESIQDAIDEAPEGGTIFIRPGTYRETITISKPLHLIGVGRPGSVVIQDPGGERNGIVARDVDGISLVNLTVRGFSGNGILFVDVDGFLFFRLVTDQLREGAYGLFPVRSRNGIIARCTATGADDAGIYVGQSRNVAVVHNEAYGNVIGLEAENVSQTVWAHNRSYQNAAGMLAILLPESEYIEVVQADQLRVAHNDLSDNNVDNFAEEGELASFVPKGTGLLVFGYDDSVVEHNRVDDNGFVGIGLGSSVTLWFAAGRDLARLAAIDPHPDDVRIRKNVLQRNGAGDPLALPGLEGGIPPTDLLWDRPVIDALAAALPGFPFAEYGTGNCWEDNRFETSFPDVLPSCESL